MTKLLRIVTGDGEAVEFDSEAIVVRHKQEGVEITPSSLHPTNEIGFLVLFYPWGEVRQIKEYERGSNT